MFRSAVCCCCCRCGHVGNALDISTQDERFDRKLAQRQGQTRNVAVCKQKIESAWDAPHGRLGLSAFVLIPARPCPRPQFDHAWQPPRAARSASPEGNHLASGLSANEKKGYHPRKFWFHWRNPVAVAHWAGAPSGWAGSRICCATGSISARWSIAARRSGETTSLSSIPPCSLPSRPSSPRRLSSGAAVSAACQLS
jgi:hypothetical protein